MADDPGLGEQVERLRQIVEDLRATQAAQRADDAGGERWQARLTSLETRLEMAEGTFRSESERVQSAVRGVEALGRSLEDVLDGAAAVAETGRMLQSHVDRERTVAAALEGLADQLNQFTETLAGEIRRTGDESSRASKQQLDAAVRAVTEAAATVAGTTEVMPRVDRAIAAIGEVRQELAAVSTRLDPTARLDSLAEAAARIDARLTQAAGSTAQQVREALAEREAADDVTPALDAMRADLRHAVRALTTEQPAALDRLPAAVDAIAGDLAGLTARLDEIRGRTEVNGRDLSALADVPATLTRIGEDLAALATLPASIDGLGGAVEGAVAVHRRSAAAVETLQQSIDAARADVGAAASATQHLEQRLDDATEASAAANKEALEAALEQQREAETNIAAAIQGKLEGLAGTLSALVNRPAPETGVALAVRTLATDAKAKADADAEVLTEVNDRLAAIVEALVTQARIDETATDDVAARLTAIGEATARLGAIDESVAMLAAEAKERAELTSAAGGDDPNAILTKGQLDAALASLTSDLTDGPALPTVDDLRTAVLTLQTDLAQLAKTADQLASRPVPNPPPAVSPADLEQAVQRLEERLGEGPAPISRSELDAAIAGLRLAITSLPTPPGVDEVAAAVRITLPELPATSADVQRAAATIAATVDARLASNVLEDFRTEIARIVEFRTEILGAITDLRKHGPMAAASSDDVQAAAEGVVGAVRDAVGAATADLRAELDLVRRAVDGLQALRQLAAGAGAGAAASAAAATPTDVDAQLDAIGRLVHHAVKSLHLIEESTVGVTSGRAEVNAAVAELDAARQRRAANLS